MNIRSFTLLACTALSLSACQTLEGLQKDLSSIGSATSNKVAAITANNNEDTDSTTTNKSVALTAITNESCPAIIIDPQLDSMSEFEDMTNPSENSAISMITLTSAISECDLTDEHIEMRLDLKFKGELGPKARRTKSDRPFFAYPYFIRVTDDEDNQLAQEIFAASLTYEADQNMIELVETINQRLPLNENGSLPPYQIHIGFQLSEEQLFYNASK